MRNGASTSNDAGTARSGLARIESCRFSAERDLEMTGANCRVSISQWPAHPESHGFERSSMDAKLIALIDKGARFSFQGEPFRSRREIPNDDIVDIDFSQTEITDAEVEALLPLENLEGISFWNSGISDQAIEQISRLHHLTRLNL